MLRLSLLLSQNQWSCGCFEAVLPSFLSGCSGVEKMNTWSEPTRLLRMVLATLLGWSLCFAPMFTAQAQVVLGPAQQELPRVTQRMNAAQKGSDSELWNAILDGRKTISAANQLPTNEVDGLIAAATDAYAKASVEWITRLTASCEKRKFRGDGKDAKNMLSALEGNAGKFLNKAAITKLKTRIEKCLLPPTVFKGKGTSTFKSDSGSRVVTVNVTWTLNTFLPPGSLLDISSYTPSGTVTVEASEDDCKGSGKFAITSGLLIITLDNEVAASGMPVGDSYQFALATTDLLMMKCPKGDPYAAPGGSLSSNDAIEINTIDSLSGSANISGSAESWTFKAIDEGKP